MSKPEFHASVRFVCRAGHEHTLCVRVAREVPKELRCDVTEGSGIVTGGGGCPVPTDLGARAIHALQGNVEQSRRLGYVLVQE